jgi:hypothetical protein
MGEGRCPADPFPRKCRRLVRTCLALMMTSPRSRRDGVSHAAAPRKPSRFRAPPPERVKVPVRQGWRDKGRELVFRLFLGSLSLRSGKRGIFFCLGRSAGLRAGMNFRHEPKCAETHAKIPVGREGRRRLRSARGKSRGAVNFVLWADVMTHFGQYFGLYFSTDALFTACK